MSDSDYFECLRCAFELYHPGESYLPTPVVLKLNHHHDLLWVCYSLVSTKLRTLKIQLPNNASHFWRGEHIATATNISTLSIRAPLLNELRLDGELHGILTSASVSGLEHLRCFQSDQSIEDEVLQSLASLPRLVKLEFVLSNEFLSVPPGSSSSPSLFPSLQSLQITASRLPPLAHFMQCYIHSGPAPIQDLRIVIDWRKIKGCHTAPENPLIGLDIVLAAGRLEQHLTSLIIFTDVDPPWPRLSAHPVLSFRDITPLFQCARLQFFTINAGYSLAGFRNSALEEMAAAWPQLRALQLVSYPQTKPMPCTILCLRHFARCCPDLDFISLSFSPTPCGKIRRAGPGAINSSMESLAVGCSPLEISDVPVVAPFLARLFPNLLFMDYSSRHRNGLEEELKKYGSAWSAVTELLRERRKRASPNQH